MALFKFTKSILADEPVEVFNSGKHTRDFTYIDDIVEGVMKVVDVPAKTDVIWNGLSLTQGRARRLSASIILETMNPLIFLTLFQSLRKLWVEKLI